MLMDYIWSQNRAMSPIQNGGSGSNGNNNKDGNSFLATLIIYTLQVYR
jgi:hypothetical protein